LISDAVDRAVSDINFRVLAGRRVFFDPQYLKVANADDNQYLTSTLRQHLLSCGCVLAEKREDAEYIVEARSGAVGTDRHDLLYGLPATNLGSFAPVPGVPAAIPEIPLAKRTSQRGVAKLAVFAYERESGEPVWQSGVSQYTSNSRNVWVLGVGPFQSGTIYRGTNFAGREIPNPLAEGHAPSNDPVWVTKEARFQDDVVERLASSPHDRSDAHPPVAAATPRPSAPPTVSSAPPAPAPSRPETTAGFTQPETQGRITGVQPGGPPIRGHGQ
ncbi:MAG: hypothetical protein DCC68_26890, partial [Planctomycetota bacterium]